MVTATTDDLPVFPFGAPAGEPWAPVSWADQRRVEEPMIRVALPFGGWAWLVTRHADVRNLLRDPAFTADINRPGFPQLGERPERDASNELGILVHMDGERHARLRRMLAPEFTVNRIRRFEPLIEETVAEPLRAMRDAGPPADLVEAFALPVPSKVICHLLGVPYQDHAFFQAASRALLDFQAPAARIRAAQRELREYLRSLIASKRAGGDRSDDLLSRMIAQQVATGALDPEELVGIGAVLLIAGHGTTSIMITLSTLLLQRYPRQWASLAADPSTAEALVEELLRYLTIARSGLARMAIADVEIGGRLIRAGEGVVALLPTANRDPAVFAEPDEFEPRRAANQHVAFGFGVHQCVGQQLARAELRIALVELARAFPRLRVTTPPCEIRLHDRGLVLSVPELQVAW